MRTKPQKLFFTLFIVMVCILYQPLAVTAQNKGSKNKSKHDSKKDSTEVLKKETKKESKKKADKKKSKQNTQKDSPEIKKEIRKKPKKRKQRKAEKDSIEAVKKEAEKTAKKAPPEIKKELKKESKKRKQRRAERDSIEAIRKEAKTAARKDTSNVYKKLKKWAYKRGFTAFLYDCVFTEPRPPVDINASNNKSLSNKQKKKDPNAKFAGKIIGNIEIEVYDPFGHSVNDTITRPITKLQNAGNKTHITTRNRIIRNLLLFRRNEKVDILKITESERIIRQTSYVNDARIHIIPRPGSRDSVDIKVVVHDRWAWEGWLELTDATSTYAAFRDRNILGLGHQFDQSIDHDFSTNQSKYRTRYYINNISHTYISSTATYNNAPQSQDLGVAFNRSFYSPLTKWAGGISGVKVWNTFRYYKVDSTLQQLPLESFNSDYWLARGFNPRKSNTLDNRSKNISVAVRYANTHFQKRPSFDLDTNVVNVHSNLYLVGLAYSVRKFYKDKYIYRFGANEDIPEGWLIQGAYGILDKEHYRLRHYIGVDISTGKHFDRFGYISGGVSYGNFFNTEVRSNVTINGNFLYFSNLLKMGRWSLRQFFKYKIVYGINKPPVETISLTPVEMYGLNSLAYRGTRKMVFNSETVMYTPYQVIGFRFAAVVLIGMGLIDTEERQFFHTQVYQSYAAGVLIRNENLLVNSIQISIGGYPYALPGSTSSHFRLNPIASFSLRISGFAAGKPTPVLYQ